MINLSSIKNIWFNSDEHYFHTKILKYTNRPFNDVLDMNQYFIEQHNKNVNENDLTIHLGDFTFKEKEFAFDIVNQLSGKHIFIRGNHDYWLENEDEIIQNKLIKDKLFFIDYSFDPIRDYFEFKYRGLHFVMLHFPMLTWHKSHRGSICLHGHTHATINNLNDESGLKRIDVGIDSAAQILNEYRPFHISEIIDLMSTKKENKIDFT